MLFFLLTSLALAQDAPESTEGADTAAATPLARERAVELFENGSKLYEEGAYEAAIVAFRESLRLSAEPALHYNIANALERLGELEAARDELNTYRALAPADEADSLDRRLAAMDRRIQEEAAAAEAARLAAIPPTQLTPQPAAPAPVAPPPAEASRRSPRWALVVAGGTVAALGGAGAGITYGNAQAAEDDLDRATYDQQRTLNGVSWGGVGVGVGIAVLGFALPTSSPVQATPGGLGVHF
jgi:tetratricopeptide (TPR) repeat protein